MVDAPVYGPLLPGGYCWYCGIRLDGSVVITVREHVFPRHYAVTPIVPACHFCNSSKGSRNLEEFRQMLLRRAPAFGGVHSGLPGNCLPGWWTPGEPVGTRRPPTFWYERVGLDASPIGQEIRYFSEHAARTCVIQEFFYLRAPYLVKRCVTCTPPSTQKGSADVF